MLRVLTYHRIADPADTSDLDPKLVSATPDVFRDQMRHLRKRYRPVSLEDVVAAFRRGRALPDRAVHVTVDDAYRDFGEFAWPILRELRIPVTVFVPTAYPGDPERAFWWDRLHRIEARTAGASNDAITHDALLTEVGDAKETRELLRLLPHDEAEYRVDVACSAVGLGTTSVAMHAAVLSWDELRELQSEGVRFGAHTRNHVALTRVEPDRARREIRRSLDDLSRELGEGARTIAYPYGIHDETIAEMAADEGCLLGFTSDDGLARPGRTDPMRIPRTNITPRTTPVAFAIRMLPWFTLIDRWRHRHQRAVLTQ